MKHSRMTWLVVAGTLAVSAINGELTVTAAQSCESLALLKLPNTTITVAESVRAGGFRSETPPPFPGAPIPAYDQLPPFCRVAATIKPSNDSEIKFEVWMPVIGWNGKFQAVGNGVWWGQIERALTRRTGYGLRAK